MKLPSLYYFVNPAGEFLVYTLHYENSPAKMTLRCPDFARNEIDHLCHATSIANAERFLSILLEDGHVDLDPEMSQEHLRYLKIVCYKVQEETTSIMEEMRQMDTKNIKKALKNLPASSLKKKKKKK